MTNIDNYEEAIRTRVCVQCIERTGRGICGMGKADECALNQFMPSLIKVANTIEAGSFDDYISAIHTEIVGQSQEIPASLWTMEQEVELSLAPYLPLIIEAIAEVNQRRRVHTV